MPLGVVSGVSRTMGVLDGDGDRRGGRGSFGSKCEAFHCNQGGFCCVVVGERRALPKLLLGDLLAIRRPNGCTVASGVVGVVVVVVVAGVCNHSQMRTSKCTCLVFGVSIGLDPG